MTDSGRLNIRLLPGERTELDHHARRAGESITDYIRAALAARYALEEPVDPDAGLLLGYIHLDRYGDLEPADTCPTCGREYGASGIWLRVHQPPTLSGPLCGLCADSA